MVDEVTYLSSAGNQLRFTQNINQAPPGPGAPAQVNARRPYPAYGSISMYKWDGNSHYNSLQSRLQQRYSHGLSFLASYTYSHSIDDINNRTNQLDPQTGKGSSSFDIRQRLALSHVYELPFGAAQRFATTGVQAKLV